MVKKVVNFTLLLLCIITGTASADFKLPDTGQTKCYQTIDPYGELSCNGTGQDGAYSINPMSYTDHGNGTVTDNNTGLMWQKEDDNQTYNWYQASGTYSATNNPSTIDVCGSLKLGNQSGWRLPTKKELMSLVDYGVSYLDPAIMSAYFPNTNESYYWSSNPTPNIFSHPWVVDFATGNTRSYEESSAGYVRCVHGGETTRTLVDNGNGIVTDSRSRLMWQQGEPGAMTWGSALAYCEGLSLGGHSDWRLPNVKELESLMDDTRNRPAIDTSYFPNVFSSDYWPSTTQNLGIGWARCVDFTWGTVKGSTKDSSNYVRCVRGGEPGAVVNLTVTRNGSGTGSVAADSGTISWAGTTGTADYLFGASFMLTPTPDITSLFSGWSGCGSSGAETCTVTMIGDVMVTALFNLKPARIAGSTPPYFATLQGAHDTAIAGDTIEAQGVNFPESLTVSKPLTLKGGFDGSYSGRNGFTSVQGLIVMNGPLTMENLIIM
jgi:hypothetical protein